MNEGIGWRSVPRVFQSHAGFELVKQGFDDEPFEQRVLPRRGRRRPNSASDKKRFRFSRLYRLIPLHGFDPSGRSPSTSANVMITDKTGMDRSVDTGVSCIAAN